MKPQNLLHQWEGCICWGPPEETYHVSEEDYCATRAVGANCMVAALLHVLQGSEALGGLFCLFELSASHRLVVFMGFAPQREPVL